MTVAMVTTLLPALMALVTVTTQAGPLPQWSPEQIALIASMRLKEAGPAHDPSNAYEGSTDAIALGRALFHDPGFSANGQVSCASCHAADLQFGDTRPRGQGMGIGRRRTM